MGLVIVSFSHSNTCGTVVKVNINDRFACLSENDFDLIECYESRYFLPYPFWDSFYELMDVSPSLPPSLSLVSKDQIGNLMYARQVFYTQVISLDSPLCLVLWKTLCVLTKNMIIINNLQFWLEKPKRSLA